MNNITTTGLAVFPEDGRGMGRGADQS